MFGDADCLEYVELSPIIFLLFDKETILLQKIFKLQRKGVVWRTTEDTILLSYCHQIGPSKMKFNLSVHGSIRCVQVLYTVFICPICYELSAC